MRPLSVMAFHGPGSSLPVTALPHVTAQELALLCHKRPTALGSLPHARHGVAASRARPWSRYSVAMDVGTWRSGRTGSPPRREPSGYASGSEEGQRLRGGKPGALGRQEGVGGDA